MPIIRELTKPASETSDASLVLSRPASPDDRILRETFVKIARNSNSESNNGTPENEKFVMWSHGSRTSLNDMLPEDELTNAAKYVQQKSGYVDGFGVTIIDNCSNLMSTAKEAAADKTEGSLAANNSNNAILVPTTGCGFEFDAGKKELDGMDIQCVVTKQPIPTGSKKFVRWVQKNVPGTIAFILKERPTENTITPNWD